MCSCITKKLFKIILNLYTCIQHTSTQPNIKRQKLHQSSRNKFGAPDVRQFCPGLVSFP